MLRLIASLPFVVQPNVFGNHHLGMHHLYQIQINMQAELSSDQMTGSAVTVAFKVHQAVAVNGCL